MTSAEFARKLERGDYDRTLAYLYTEERLEPATARYQKAVAEFAKLYGDDREIRLFSAPGRTEIGGNHTDHQRGRVLAASVNLDVIAVASLSGENIIRVKSEGHSPDTVELADVSIREEEKNRSASLIRGIAARCRELGYEAGGFDAYTTSDVLKGSGLSSSAAFEVVVGRTVSGLCNGGRIPAVEIAQIGQYAENNYFGKPCGLMDQTASSVGGFVAIDFEDPAKPVIDEIPFDFAAAGHVLCIVDTGGNHADLTHEYASIPPEMKKVAAFFGKGYLREVDERELYKNLAAVRERCGDRPLLRAMHFFADNARVPLETAALRNGDFDAFKRLVVESGRSSQGSLQNVFAASAPGEQGLSLALALSERLLAGKGAWRVHGGGFAGTIQAFVPAELLASYRGSMEALFGRDSCYELSIRPVGGVEITESL